LAITDMENNYNRLRLADSKNYKIVCASPIHRLCAAGVGQNKRIVSAVVDIRKITTVSANQPMVETYQKKCIGSQLLRRNIIDSKKTDAKWLG
jgi:hypothetical protein